MYARKENGSIKKYISIPKAWGSIIGGFNLLSATEWNQQGFYSVVTPSYNSSTQKLGDLEWDADSSTFTYPVINRTWTQTVAELKEAKIANLKAIYNRKLSETDWYIVREAEGGTAAPQSILDDRTALRTECGTKEGEINAKTTKAAVVSYSLPNLD